MQLSGIGLRTPSTIAIVAALVGLAACGSSKKSTSTASTASATAPATLALSISESGNSSKFAGPSSVRAGLVTVQLTNNGRSIHGAQLIRVVGAHTIEEAVKSLGGESHKTPRWLRAEGGVGAAPPGQAASAGVSLPAGNYAVIDLTGAREGGGTPAIARLTVTQGTEAAVPTTGTVITAANPSKDHYKWEVSGPLKAGANPITFVSKGKTALHELTAIRITKEVPTAQLVKDLESNGPPPSYIDPSSVYGSAALDGGKSLNTQMVLLKPGKYAFICHLTDRDGGKPHFAEGLITTVNVQ